MRHFVTGCKQENLQRELSAGWELARAGRAYMIGHMPWTKMKKAKLSAEQIDRLREKALGAIAPLDPVIDGLAAMIFSQLHALVLAASRLLSTIPAMIKLKMTAANSNNQPQYWPGSRSTRMKWRP
jgi:hypothetical protein